MKTIKNTLILIFAGLLFGITANRAAVISITVGNFQFTPASVTAPVGDTIKWTWVSGPHTTTSTTSPAGAAAWDKSMTSSADSLLYVLNFAGTYNYKCTPHLFTGVITVTPVSSVFSQGQNERTSSIVFPSPFTDKTTVSFSDPIVIGFKSPEKLIIYSITGKMVLSYVLSINQQELEINLTKFPSGVYFYSLIEDGIVIETKKIIKVQ